MASLTAAINSTFARLAAQGPFDMPPHALRAALLPEEHCAAHPSSCHSRASLSERCWQDDGCGAVTLLNMRERGSLTRRYDLYGDGDLSRPAAASQLGADGPWPELLFLGDSVMMQIANYGMACELSRAQREERVDFDFTYMNGGEIGQLWAAVLPMRARQRGVVVVSFGLHYDNDANSSRSSKGTRAEFNADVEQVFGALDTMRRGCARCGALFLTTTSQHFPTADGAYVAPKASSEPAAASYGCRALPAALADEASPQRWREDDVLRIAVRYPRVAVAPLTTLSRSWWDMHIGATSHSWRGVAYAGANATTADAKVRVDCTHLCYSLFLWEPVWWALRLVVRAAAEATLESAL